MLERVGGNGRQVCGRGGSSSFLGIGSIGVGCRGNSGWRPLTGFCLTVNALAVSHSYSSNCQLGVTCSLNHVLRAGGQVKGSLGQLELRDEGSPVGGVEGYLGSSLISCMHAALPLCVSELISQTLSQFWQASIINLATMCLLQDDCSLRHSVQANKR